MTRAAPAERIRLLISDVDGTLVTDDKRLTPASIDAARALEAAGIPLVVISARPPEGLATVTGPLGISTPRAGFNGGSVLDAAGRTLRSLFAPRQAVETAAALFRARRIDLWVFAEGKWLVDRLDAAFVGLETRTLGYGPTLVDDLTPYFDRAGKVVGTTDDFDLLRACEGELAEALGSSATAHLSQRYYLDVTHKEADKAHGAPALAALMGVPMAETACIGDMTNDIGMLRAAGLAIAMGNGPEAVKQAAHVVTESNEQDGFAAAVARFVLPRVR